MTLLDIARELTPASALISMGCAVYVAVRSGKWRESDDAKDMDRRIITLERKVDGLDGKDMKDRLQKVEHGLVEVKADLRGVATKADLESLKSEVRSIGRHLDSTGAAVTRIEGYLLEHDK